MTTCRLALAALILFIGHTATLAYAQTQVSINVSSVRQRIDGFGASSAWTAQSITDAQADLFFSTDKGLGLSLLRVRIAPSGNSWETATAVKAVARGAQVWATPWSPPGAWKTNGTDNNGGSLLPEYYDDWAARLAQFVINMKNAGVPILTLSAQNEPNWTAVWETCRWTPTELTGFIRDYLGPALVAKGVSTRVLAPESIDWYSIDDYADNLLGDATARGYISHVATHSYGGTAFAYSAPAAAGLPFWQTEYSDSGATSDPTIASALRVSAVIHDFLTVAQGSAWHYWWMYPSTSGGSSSSALVEANAMTKRGWALGNWARFVRPGQRRVDTNGSTSTLRVTGFIQPDGRRISTVLVNSSTSALQINLSIAGGTVPSFTPWETSATRSLESLAPIAVGANGTFVITVPAQSITTLVSDAMNRPPSSLSLSTSAISENAPAGTPVGRPLATDPDPGETLAYSLVAGAGDTDNALFTISGGFLRNVIPIDYEAGATRTIRLRATDLAGAYYEQSITISIVNNPAEYADWAATLPAAADRSATADADADGVPNLLAYALGQTNGIPLPTSARPSLNSGSQGELRFGFEFGASAPPDLTYVIQRSTDLATWSDLATMAKAGTWGGAVPVLMEQSAPGRIRASVQVTGGETGRFYRLRVLITP